MRTLLLTVLTLLLSIWLFAGCSKNAPTEPQSPIIDNTSREIIAAGMFYIDTETMTIIPCDDRASQLHFNVTSLLSGSCPGGCFRWRITSFIGGILTIELTLENPTSLQVYDARIVFNYLDQKTIENADGYTDIFHAGQVNPFIAFAKALPNRAFPIGPHATDVQTALIKWTSGSAGVAYFIEVSLGGNCKEPFLIHDQMQIGQLTQSGGSAKIHVEVSDHQDDVSSVLVNTIPLTGGVSTLVHTSGETWELNITNSAHAPIGNYKCLIGSTSPGETAKLYDYITLVVSEEANEAWDSFGGNRRNTGRTDVIGPQTNHIQWFNDHTFTGDYHTIGAPVIDSDGNVYYHYTPNPTNGIFFKVKASDGSVMWQHDPDNDDAGVANKEMYTVAALDETAGYVYYPCMGGIWCVQMSNGNYVKHYATTGDMSKGSPTVASGNVYVSSTKNSEAIISFNSGLSSTRYAFNVTDGAGTSPALDSSGNAFFPSFGTAKKFHGLNPSGIELFTPLVVDSEAKRLVSPAIDDDGAIYYQTSGYRLYSIKPNGVSNWSFFSSIPNTYFTSPALGHDDAVYIFRENVLYAVYKSGGGEKWSFIVNEYGITPIVGGDETVYFMTYSGKIYAFDPVSKTYKWTYDTGRPLSTYIVYRYQAAGALGPDGLLVFCGNAGVWAFKDL